MAEKLTNEQQAAVDSRERSLLVSAAAGSGKTKVLVERLFSYVEREGANLDDFLIITYTRAAASELRGKIAKALTERMERDPGNYHLRQQMLRVYRADIKTVDAFCTALLRENCHLLGEDARGHALRPDFRVLDENEAQVLRERVLARTLDDFYGRLTTGGTLLADTLGAGRDDSALEDLVLELHAKLQAQPYEDKWLEAQRAFWRAVPDKIEDTPYGKILLNEVRRKARHCKNLLQRAAQEMCANDALNQKYAPAFLDASYQLEALEGKTAEGWDAARGVTIAFPRLAAVKDSDGGEMKARMKSLWDNCKETVKGFAAMGATVREGDYICAAAEGGRMRGANIYLDVVSVGATMNIMMAAALADGTTVIPVSRVSFGFGAGGSDFASKHAQAGAPMAFGGGGGAGVTVSPVCFLIITKDGSASILGINAQADSTVDRLVEMIPGAINRVSSFVEGFSGKKKAPADESAPMEGGEE